MKPFTNVMVFSVLYNIFQNMVHPVTPTLLTDLGFSDYMFGALFASMALGMMVMSPIWGSFCDKHGRKAACSLGGLIYIVGQLMFYYATTEPLSLLARLVGGVGGSGPLVGLMASAVDLTDERNRAARLSIFAAVTTVSASLGYFLGGMLGTLSMAHVFYIQAVLMLVTSVAGYMLMPQTYHPDTLARAHRQRFSLKEGLRVMTAPLLIFLACTVMSNLGTYGYDNAFNYYIKRELGFPSSYNGIIKAVTGILGLLATLFFNRLLIRRFSVEKTLAPVLAACALSLLLSMVMPTNLFIGVNMVFCLFNAMYQPLQQALITRASDCDFGLLSGLFNSARSLGMIVGALAAGLLYAASPMAPFAMQVVCFALAALAALAFCRVVPR